MTCRKEYQISILAIGVELFKRHITHRKHFVNTSMSYNKADEKFASMILYSRRPVLDRTDDDKEFAKCA